MKKTDNFTKKVVGNLTKIDEEYKITKSGQKRKFVNCICVCGNKHSVDMTHWRAEKTKSCGCLKYKCLIGKSYGRLTVLEDTGKRRLNSTGEKYWKCKCICGNISEVATTDLTKSKGTRSCGCLVFDKDLSEVRVKRVYSRKKSDARKRNVNFDLTEKDLENIINRKCFYCGTFKSNKMKSDNTKIGFIEYMGIDRKDSSIGYTAENSIPCCFKCNTMKNRKSFKEYLMSLNK